MRFMAQGQRQLASFSPPMKISLTFFIVFMLLGLASSLAFYHQQFSFDSAQASLYYRGNADDLEAQTFFVEKSYRQMLEVTHFHAYIMPVVYLAFIHLYFLSTRSEREKTIMAVVTFGSLLLEMLTPWLVRYAFPGLSGLFWVSGLGISAGTVWMSVVCIWEMWGKGPGSPLDIDG